MTQEDNLAFALMQAQQTLDRYLNVLNKRERNELLEREQVLADWMKQRGPRKGWLCMLLGHRWSFGHDQPCKECGAPRPKEALQ